MFNKLNCNEVAVRKSNALISKLQKVLGNSSYRLEEYEQYIVINLVSIIWFTCNPTVNPTLIVVDEKQFEYILDMYNMGIPLESNIIQNFLIQCKGE